MSCCSPQPQKSKPHEENSCCSPQPQRDYLLWITSFIMVIGVLWHFFHTSDHQPIDLLAHSIAHSLSELWIGLFIGILVVGVIEQLPEGLVPQILGTDHGWKGILRAILAGLAFDVCSHGILLIAMGLYRKGVSLGQVFAFLIASPWNSFSLTLILISLIGLPWSIAFIGASAIVAFFAGYLVEKGVKKGLLPKNRYQFVTDSKNSTPFIQLLKSFHLPPRGWVSIIFTGFKSSQMLFRWLFLGILLTALIQVFVPTNWYQTWFGPHLLGLLMTLIGATIIEVCSEGSVPIASDLFTRAQAPGNAFAFLMAGVSTDYTEIITLRQVTGSWKLALLLPCVTVPQIVILSWIMNHF